MFRIILLISFFGISHLMTSQELMSIGKEKVNVEEFLRIYQKNNHSTNSYSEKEINEYVELFTLFKMKLQEARRLKLDTLPSVKDDYQKYTDQLIQNYFVDKQYLDSIWRSQYENMKYDVKVAHIMVKCSPNASPADTQLAYNKINFLKQKATAGNFAQLAAENSEDPSSAPKGGLLGYIAAFMTFHAFENPCFSTPVGSLSQIFRTEYGYHFLHVLDKRPARGRIKVAHIYLKKTEKPVEAEKKIREIFQLVTNKKLSFEDAVAKYSEDASTKDTKGALPEFGVSEMVSDFEEQCFALKNSGDISKPFMTEYGWHMVKLIEKNPIKSYEESKEYIQQRMARDPRISNLREVAYGRMIEKFKLLENANTLNTFSSSLIDTFFLVNNWVLKPAKNMESAVLFTFAGKNFTLKEFLDFSNQNYRTARSRSKMEALKVMYEAYREKTIWNHTRIQLAANDSQFSNLESEYLNGLLIFEIMDREIWKKAVSDTIGTKKLYEEVKNNYWYTDRAILEGLKSTKSNLLDPYETKIAEKPIKHILSEIKMSKDSNDIVYYEKTLERGEYTEIDQALNLNHTIVKFKVDEKNMILAKITKVLPPSIKPFSEVKGRIQNLYQNKLEKDWAVYLRARYPVKINSDQLKKIIKN